MRIARKQLGKTVQEAASGAGIHFQAWYLTECGVYNDIPPKIDSYLYSFGFLLKSEEYTAFRQANQRKFGEIYLIGKGLPAVSNLTSPIKSYREHVGIRSRTFFSKGLCVQPAHTYGLEKGSIKNLPTQIVDALVMAGVPKDDVEELDERTQVYYESH